MSYEKMMKFQRTSILKQKRSSYRMGIICSIPSDADRSQIKCTSDIGDYPELKKLLTPEQYRVAKYLMSEYRFKGLPSFKPVDENIKRNFMYTEIQIDGEIYFVRRYAVGFDVAY